MIDLTNGELTKYNNHIELFNTVFVNYQRDYTRTHMPKQNGLRFF